MIINIIVEEEIIKGEGSKKIFLWVYEENIRARKFYKKHGFTFDGSKKHSRFSNKLLELRYIKRRLYYIHV